jgi:hypothetical protein
MFLSVFVIIFQTDTDQIFDGYWIRIGYRTDINTNMNIFRILNKNIACIIVKKCIVFYEKNINYKI